MLWLVTYFVAGYFSCLYLRYKLEGSLTTGDLVVAFGLSIIAPLLLIIYIGCLDFWKKRIF